MDGREGVTWMPLCGAQVEDVPGGDSRERLRQRIESYKSELRRIDAKIGRLRNDREGVMRRLDEAMQRLHAPTANLRNDEVRRGVTG